MEYIDACTFVHLKINCWSAQKTLNESDIILGKGGELPPKEAARLGNKYVYNRDKLKVFETLRASAKRSCLAIGTNMLGAYAVHNAGLTSLQKKLDETKVKFESEVQNLLRTYDQDARDWIHRNFKQPVQPVPAEDVERAFRFDYTLYQITGSALPSTDDFADSVLSGVAAEVKQLWKASIAGRSKISQRFLNSSFEDLYGKLKMLSFGDGRILRVLSVMDHLKTNIPKTGGILQGTREHLLLTNILMALMSPERLLEILDNQSGIWTLPSGQPVQQEQTQVVVPEPESILIPDPQPVLVEPEPVTTPEPTPVATPVASGWF